MTNRKDKGSTYPFNADIEGTLKGLFAQREEESRGDTDGDLPGEDTGFPYGVQDITRDDLIRSVFADTIEHNPFLMESPYSGRRKAPHKFSDKKQVADKEKDMVNHPDHYNQGLLETMEKFFLFFHHNPDMIKGALLFNILKYSDREQHKGKPEEDREKAEFYLNVFETLFEEDADLLNLYRVFKGKD